MTRLLDGRHHLERFAMEHTGEVNYLNTWRDTSSGVTTEPRVTASGSGTGRAATAADRLRSAADGVADTDR